MQLRASYFKSLLLSTVYGPQNRVREKEGNGAPLRWSLPGIHADYPIQPCRTPEQVMRSKRLFHILQQQFVGYIKIENLIRSDFCHRNHRIQRIRTASADSQGILLDVKDGSVELSRDVLEVSCEENRTSLGHHPGS